MTLLVRLGVFWLVVGLVTGLILRGRLGLQRLPQLYALSALPWLAHLVYTAAFTLGNTDGLELPLALFVGSSLLLGAAALLLPWRLWRPSVRLAVAPVALVVAHLTPLMLFTRALRRAGLGNAGLGMDALPMVAFLVASLFFTGVLLAFTAGRPAARGGWLARRRRF